MAATRSLCTVAASTAHFRVVVVGGGSAGLGATAKLSRLLPQGHVAVVEPNLTHYYQPGFTLVGGGQMTLAANTRDEKDLIPKKATWINRRVEKFLPASNALYLSDGITLTYDYMVIAAGMELRFDLIEGLREALDTPGVCTNYDPHYAQKTARELQEFKMGNAIFTFPNTPIKCPGAMQKICYIADEVFRERGVRDHATLHYFTTLPRIFGVVDYANALMKIVKEKDIQLHTRHNLVSINWKEKKVVFEHLNEEGKGTGKTVEYPYSFLHVGPPCSPIKPLRECPELTDANGWVKVDPITLQSCTFPNVFGVGDCANTPNAKTAAAVSSHLKTMEKNFKSLIAGKELKAKYDGYGSCPLVVGKSKAIMAEFNSAGRLETTPFDQSIPRYAYYLLKRYFMPWLYWHGLVKGYWNGPATLRKVLHLFTKS